MITPYVPKDLWRWLQPRSLTFHRPGLPRRPVDSPIPLILRATPASLREVQMVQQLRWCAGGRNLLCRTDESLLDLARERQLAELAPARWPQGRELQCAAGVAETALHGGCPILLAGSAVVKSERRGHRLGMLPLAGAIFLRLCLKSEPIKGVFAWSGRTNGLAARSLQHYGATKISTELLNQSRLHNVGSVFAKAQAMAREGLLNTAAADLWMFDQNCLRRFAQLLHAAGTEQGLPSEDRKYVVFADGEFRDVGFHELLRQFGWGGRPLPVEITSLHDLSNVRWA